MQKRRGAPLGVGYDIMSFAMTELLFIFSFLRERKNGSKKESSSLKFFA